MGTPNSHRLILIRHAKSSWDEPLEDHDRPLAPRGIRQAPAIGTWLATPDHDGGARIPDLALVSTAVRARQTWEHVTTAISAAGVTAPTAEYRDDLYTFSARQVRAVLAALPTTLRSVAIVGHNPAFEDLASDLIGSAVRLPTSAVAVVDLSGWSASAGTLVTSGRPADWS